MLILIGFGLLVVGNSLVSAAVPPTRCTIWPDQRVFAGFTWNERCRNCTCVEGEGTVCDGPVCPMRYKASQEATCGRWSQDGCCCEEIGCYKHGKMYAMGEFYPVRPDSPCEECMCSHPGTQRCRRKNCRIECVDAVLESGACCPTCRNGANCEMPPLYTASGKVVNPGVTTIRLNDYDIVADMVESTQTWNCTCTVGAGVASCEQLNLSVQDLLMRLIGAFSNV